MTNIIMLRKATKDALSLVGEKAVQLSILAQKFPVPPGCIMTAHAHQIFLEQTGIAKKIHSLLQQLKPENKDQLEHTSSTIRNIILSTEIPDMLVEEMTDAYYSLNIEEGASLQHLMTQGEEPVVVMRPSPVGYNGKGMHESCFGIYGMASLKTALLECWASFYTPEALAIQKKQAVGFAVIIQKMIDSQASGVFYTSYKMNPEEVLIESCKGLGVVLKNSLITPDRYFITKKTLNTAAIEFGKQLFMLERDFDTQKTTRVYLQEEYSKKQKITDQHIGELTLMSAQIESMFGKPQVVDFAVHKDNLFLVGIQEAEWYHEMSKKERQQKQREELLQKIPEQNEEELQKQQSDIAERITEELEQDSLVVDALTSATAPFVKQEIYSVVQQTDGKIEKIAANDQNDINSIILGMDFAEVVKEGEQVDPLQQQSASLQPASIIFENSKSPISAVTEAVAEADDETQQHKDDVIEEVDNVSEKELTLFEKAVGTFIIQCFKEFKEKLPREQWGASPELRHLAVLAQNFSQKNIAPTAAQVKFALDALEKLNTYQ